MADIQMADVVPLIGLDDANGRRTYYVRCPCCDDDPRKKHLNINLEKNVFRCPRCGFSGGIFDLYSQYTGVDRKHARKDIMRRLGIRDDDPGMPAQRTAPARQKPPEAVSIECPITDIDTRHDTYTALLDKLTLASDHRENLHSRGLLDSEIDRLGYKTMPMVGLSAIAKQLLGDGLYLAGVPGFFRKKDDTWTLTPEHRGILIPARDPEGKIQGLQIRRDNTQKGKFRWISSKDKQDGCKAECWTHISGAPAQTVLLTEGPMKADIITCITGLPVVAVPGVNSLNHLDELLLYLKANGTSKIMTAFDMDYIKNPHVQKGYMALANLIAKADIQYGTYVWDPQYKGLDDFIWQDLLKMQRTQKG